MSHYKIVGGVSTFMPAGRSKICFAYLKTIDNGMCAVRRIINVPKRGIGLTGPGSRSLLQERGLGFYETLMAPS